MNLRDKNPSFYIIVDPAFPDEQSIPPNFMDYVTEELGERATLSLPLGHRYWDIQLQKTENGVNLENGWKEFLMDNHLGDSEFLLLTYCGNMCFEVEIFKKTGCERDYQFTFTNEEEYPQENREKSSFLTEKKKRGRPKKVKNNPPMEIKSNPPVVSEKKKVGRPRKIVGSTSGIQHKLQPSESDSDMVEKPDLPLGSSGRPLEID